MRCIPNIQTFLAPLETIIQTRFLPNLTGQPSFSDVDSKQLFALLARLGGLGVVDPSQYSVFQFSVSVAITAPLVQSILRQSFASSADILCDQLEAKQCIVAEHHKSITDSYNFLVPLLSSSLHRSVLLSGALGSSSWLTALPLTEHGFALHKLKVPLRMHCVLGMVVNHLCYHQVVFVESDLLLSMLWDVHVAAILP